MTHVIFVFGSNLAGRHGAGSAKHAREYWGAVMYRGVGRMGDAYAIPTKDAELCPLPLHAIGVHVEKFLDYARVRGDLEFRIVAIGCGLAGYTPEQIAPMFADAPGNCVLPHVFATPLTGRMVMRRRWWEEAQA